MKNTYVCPRCDGAGFLPSFTHIENGVCFKCGGKGKVNYLPKDSLNLDVCDTFVFLINHRHRTPSFAQFSLWDKSPDKPSFGTGNVCVQTYIDTPYGGSWETNNKTISQKDLSVLREEYKNLICSGFVLSTSEQVDKLLEKYPEEC